MKRALPRTRSPSGPLQINPLHSTMGGNPVKKILTVLLLAAMLVTTVFPAMAENTDPHVIINQNSVDENGRTESTDPVITDNTVKTDDNGRDPNPPAPRTQTVNLTLTVGEPPRTLASTDGHTMVEYGTSNAAVVSINGSKQVAGVAAGEATITIKEKANSNGDILITKYNVTVSAAAAKSAKFDKTNVTLGVGESVTLKITHDGPANEAVTYSADNPAIAKYMGGNNIVFEATATGNTILFGKLAGGAVAQCKLTVNPAPTKLEFAATQQTLAIGQTFDLKPDLGGGYTNQGIIWEVKDQNVATVSDKGVITAVAGGITTITGRTYNGKNTTCSVTVQGTASDYTVRIDKNPLAIGESTRMTITDRSGSYITASSYASSNATVASIDKNGNIKANAAGQTIIGCVLPNGSIQQITLTVQSNTGNYNVWLEKSTVNSGETTRVLITDRNGAYITANAYTSSFNSIATVDRYGNIQAYNPGQTLITCTLPDGTTKQVTLTVQGTIGSYTVWLEKSTLNSGETTRVLITDRNGQYVTANSYVSSSNSVATVNQYGNILAYNAGQTVITCTLPDKTTRQLTLTVQGTTGNYTVWIEDNPVGVGQSTRVIITDRNGLYVTANAYSSSSNSVATVDRLGQIYAYSAGQTVITCSLPDGTSKQVTLTVQGSVMQFQAVPRSNTIAVGEQTIIDVVSDVATPYNNITVTSSNSGIVRVDTSDPLILHGVSVGNAQITVRSQSGKTVTFWMYITSSTRNLVLNTGDRDMGVGETFQLVPTDANGNKNIYCTFSSSAPQYVSVSSYGVVTAVAYQGSGSSYLAGHAVITVRTQSGAEASFSVTTYPAPYQVILGFGNNNATQRGYIVGNGVVMPAGASINLTASVNSGSKSSSITYSTANSNVATVNQYGVLVGHRAGTTTVTAKAYNGVSASMSVTITGSGGGGGGQGTARVVTASGSLNLREAPISGARIVTTIPRLATVTVLSWGTVWSEIQYAGFTGYAMSQYLDYSPNPIYPTPTPTYWPGPTGGSGSDAQVTTISGSLNLRETPTIGGRIMARIPQYAWITVYEKGATWCYVSYRGITGYVMTSYLTFSGQPYTPTPTPRPSTGMTAQVTTASGSLNLRERAVVGATILTRIPQYALVTVYEKGAQWSYVTYGGYVGYVMTGYLTFLTK